MRDIRIHLIMRLSDKNQLFPPPSHDPITEAIVSKLQLLYPQARFNACLSSSQGLSVTAWDAKDLHIDEFARIVDNTLEEIEQREAASASIIQAGGRSNG